MMCSVLYDKYRMGGAIDTHMQNTKMGIGIIRKYDSTFYEGMGQVKNGHLYLRYESSSKKTTTNWAKTLTDKKNFAILFLRMPQEFCYPIQNLREENLKIQFCDPSFFFFLTLYVSNKCSTTEEVPFWG